MPVLIATIEQTKRGEAGTVANHSKEYEMIFLLKAQMDASMKNFSLVGT